MGDIPRASKTHMKSGALKSVLALYLPGYNLRRVLALSQPCCCVNAPYPNLHIPVGRSLFTSIVRVCRDDRVPILLHFTHAKKRTTGAVCLAQRPASAAQITSCCQVPNAERRFYLRAPARTSWFRDSTASFLPVPAHPFRARDTQSETFAVFARICR